MRIRFLLTVVAAGFASAASANLLLWQVGSPVTDGTSGTEITYNYAQIMKADSNSYTGTALNNQVGDYDGTVTKVGATTFDMASVAAIIGETNDYSSKFFYIELFDESGASVGRSTIASADALESYITSASSFSSNWSGVNTWSGTSYTATPEPTSGLLMLIGAAMLGLRRRKIA